ncbi:MAG: hypothetical protein U0R19_02060 [Bryobacteraceae bacterium]
MLAVVGGQYGKPKRKTKPVPKGQMGLFDRQAIVHAVPLLIGLLAFLYLGVLDSARHPQVGTGLAEGDRRSAAVRLVAINRTGHPEKRTSRAGGILSSVEGHHSTLEPASRRARFAVLMDFQAGTKTAVGLKDRKASLFFRLEAISNSPSRTGAAVRPRWRKSIPGLGTGGGRGRVITLFGRAGAIGLPSRGYHITQVGVRVGKYVFGAGQCQVAGSPTPGSRCPFAARHRGGADCGHRNPPGRRPSACAYGTTAA